MVAQRAGIELTTFFHAMRAGAGNSFVWETEVPLVLNGTYDHGGPLSIQVKDIQLGQSLGEQFGVPMPMNESVGQIFHRALQKFGPDAGGVVPAKLVEEELGEQLRPTASDKSFLPSQWTYTASDIENGNGFPPTRALLHVHTDAAKDTGTVGAAANDLQQLHAELREKESELAACRAKIAALEGRSGRR